MLSAFKGWMFILSCTLCRFVGAALKGISFPGRLLGLLLWVFPSLADSWGCSYGYFLPWQTLGAALMGISFPGRLLVLLLWVFPSLTDSWGCSYGYFLPWHTLGAALMGISFPGRLSNLQLHVHGCTFLSIWYGWNRLVKLWSLVLHTWF